jgi:hypothetical protein
MDWLWFLLSVTAGINGVRAIVRARRQRVKAFVP